MTPVLYDTSIYIHASRAGHTSILQTRNLLQGSPLWLSAVVLEELYAGADAPTRKILLRLEREFDLIGRILVPVLSDWSRAGNILAQIGAKYGYEKIGRARLTNDALISVSAVRLGIAVLTKNSSDFQLISEFCPLQWQLY